MKSCCLEQIPEGWKPLSGAINHPKGMRWISNGRSRLDEGYESALVPEEAVIEWSNAGRRGSSEETAGACKASVHREDVCGDTDRHADMRDRGLGQDGVHQPAEGRAEV